MDLHVYSVLIFTCMQIYAFDFLEANVRLSLEQNVVEIGKPFKLRCEITEPRKRRSRQWIGGKNNDLLCFNGVVSDPRKYKEIQEKLDVYVLRISNISEYDLECPYTCRYGFKSDQTVLSTNNTNLYLIALPSNETTLITYSKRNNTYSLVIRLSKINPVPRCGILLEKNSAALPLSLENVTRNGLLYDTFYGIKSLTPLHDCGNPVKIECYAGNTSYNFYHPQSEKCIVTSRAGPQITIIIVIMVACMVVVCVLCSVGTLTYWRKRYIQRLEFKGKEEPIVLQDTLDTNITCLVSSALIHKQQAG